MNAPPIHFELIGLPDYQAAMRKPSQAFDDEDLVKMTVTKNSLGWPAANTGGFAAVYRLVGRDRSSLAVRCFVKLAPDLADRYKMISEHLTSWVPRQDTRNQFLVRTHYLERGIKIASGWKPITTMPWIEGRPLDAYMDLAMAEPYRLPRLRSQVARLAQDLFRMDIAHGDLQHRNILIEEDGKLRLVDYDGMWVPALVGRVSNEQGVPDYQHPGRTWEHFGPGMDRFSILVLYLTVLAIEHHPDVWHANSRSEGLLLREVDFRDPDASTVLATLAGYDDLGPAIRLFRRICHDDVTAVPKLDDFLREVERLTPLVVEEQTQSDVSDGEASGEEQASAVPPGHAEEDEDPSRHAAAPSIPVTAVTLRENVGTYATFAAIYRNYSIGDGASGPYRTLHLEGSDGARVDVIADPQVVQEIRQTGRRWRVKDGQEVRATGLLLEEEGRWAILLEQAAGLERGPRPPTSPTAAGAFDDDGGLFASWIRGERVGPSGVSPTPDPERAEKPRKSKKPNSGEADSDDNRQEPNT